MTNRILGIVVPSFIQCHGGETLGRGGGDIELAKDDLMSIIPLDEGS